MHRSIIRRRRTQRRETNFGHGSHAGEAAREGTEAP